MTALRDNFGLAGLPGASGPPADPAILYEDDCLLVVDKPPDMLVHPTWRERTGTLKNFLEESRPQVYFPHRLDRQTSGLLVVAKSPETARHLGFQFSRRTVDKRYLAMVAGVIEQGEIHINAPLGRDPSERPQWRVRESGKPAQTILCVLRRDADATLVELEPITGRTNQLRAHCAHIGHPILGDEWFPSRDFHSQAPRLMLHASLLAFTHPETGERCLYKSERWKQELLLPLPAS